ncbi:MAG: spherulation-specific family 4 protein [Chthonomonadales bacterium]
MPNPLLLLSAFVALIPGQAKQVALKIRLLVPAYFYPGDKGMVQWNKMISTAGRVPTVGIVNPASGPGDHVDSNYQSVLPRARKAGVMLVGYVSTSYTKVPMAKAKADMDIYLKFYPEIEGFFFDEQASDLKSVPYYAELYKYAKLVRTKGLVFTNPGTTCEPEFLTQHCI